MKPNKPNQPRLTEIQYFSCMILAEYGFALTFLFLTSARRFLLFSFLDFPAYFEAFESIWLHWVSDCGLKTQNE